MVILRHLRRNLVAYLALFVALSSSGYAATTTLLPKNSVGTKQVINHSLLRQDFKPGTLLRGARGPRGAAGATGANGATGAAGPAGTAGAPGPPGPVNLTYVVSADTALPTGTQQSQVADCPAGMVVTGGGALTPSSSTGVSVNTSSISSSTGDTLDEWFVAMNNTSGTDTTFKAEAICTTPTSVSFGAALTKAGKAIRTAH
jgi:hypothetical protein